MLRVSRGREGQLRRWGKADDGTSAADAVTQPWVGWLWRAASGWRPACSHRKLAEASRLLGEAARAAGVPDKHTLLNHGTTPATAPSF